MKIYNFPVNYSGHHYSSIHYYEQGTGALKRDRHAFDTVEISDEARKRYEAARVIELGGERTRKLSREYEPAVHAIISKEMDDPIARRERVLELKRSYTEGPLELNSDVLNVLTDLIL